jgi:hypothetical protein
VGLTGILQAGGQVGKYITEELVKLGKHKITAITRPDSTSTLPGGVEVKKVDYSNQESLVEALRGQDVLIITMNVFAPPDSQAKLIEAAAAADVPWVLPNEWGVDTAANEQLGKDTMLGERLSRARELITKLGKSSYISVACGFWYEYSLSSGSNNYGFDIENRSVVLYDDGNTRINTSTWPQCGRAVANLLALKVLPDDEGDKSPSISQFRNRYLYISSFRINQREILDSVLRVTNTSREDWKVSHEPTSERYEAGKKELQSGNMLGFAKLLYARGFYPDGSGDFETRVGLDNDVLALPTEDLDEYTKVAVKLAGEKKAALAT